MNKIKKFSIDYLFFLIGSLFALLVNLFLGYYNIEELGLFNKTYALFIIFGQLFLFSLHENIVKNCSVLGINKQRYNKDTRQILFKEIKHIYENVYGLNEIPKLNISFNNSKDNKDYDKNMSGDLIRTKFDSLLAGSKAGITPVQTAYSQTFFRPPYVP